MDLLILSWPVAVFRLTQKKVASLLAKDMMCLLCHYIQVQTMRSLSKVERIVLAVQGALVGERAGTEFVGMERIGERAAKRLIRYEQYRRRVQVHYPR
jgi:hypothetical protein